ncbi:MAG TPA: hypothetical protein VHX15_14020 [Frankiaceae bacterium]|nr:hypothetical protein [Frankiaceae bacterium]
MAHADDDDGFPGRFDPSDDLLHIVVPDDLRELDAEVTAYRRELEAARRFERRQRWRHRFTPSWARGGLPSPIFTAVLLVIATTGLLLSVFAPVTQEHSRQTVISPLAHPKEAVGTVGGLLPDVQLLTDDQSFNTRTIRPAVFVLVPAGCKCETEIRQILGQVNEVPPAPYMVIVSQGKDTTSAKLADAVDDARGPTGVRDVNGVLAKTYHASTTAPTLLLVAGDGRLAPGSPHVYHSGDRLESALALLHY